jgi:hypothetical protein
VASAPRPSALDPGAGDAGPDPGDERRLGAGDVRGLGGPAVPSMARLSLSVAVCMPEHSAIAPPRGGRDVSFVVSGLGLKVQGLEFRVASSGLGAQGMGLRFRV